LEQITEIQNKELHFKGESTANLLSLIFVVIPLSGLILTALFLSFHLIGKIIIVIIIALIVYLFLKKGIKSVTFKADNLLVTYLSKTQKSYEYDDFLYFVIKEQINPTIHIGHFEKEIISVKFKPNKSGSKKSKIYFYCPENKKNKLRDFLKTKNLKLIREE